MEIAKNPSIKLLRCLCVLSRMLGNAGKLGGSTPGIDSMVYTSRLRLNITYHEVICPSPLTMI